jgi:hypothetical protein
MGNGRSRKARTGGKELRSTKFAPEGANRYLLTARARQAGIHVRTAPESSRRFALKKGARNSRALRLCFFVIDTITSKVVLILGRFTPERKAVLDAMREELRHRDYLPVLFDFEKTVHRDLTETVSTLAHMARFVIADITDAKSIPQELLAIVPNLPSIPIQPLLLASQQEYGMFEHFRRFPWVLEPFVYEDQDRLITALTERVIGPAETKAQEQTRTASARI